MSKEISKQEKEDYLSLMYEMKRKENQIVKSDLSRELEVPLSRVTTDGIIKRPAMSRKKEMSYRIFKAGFRC